MLLPPSGSKTRCLLGGASPGFRSSSRGDRKGGGGGSYVARKVHRSNENFSDPKIHSREKQILPLGNYLEREINGKSERGRERGICYLIRYYATYIYIYFHGDM